MHTITRTAITATMTKLAHQLVEQQREHLAKALEEETMATVPLPGADDLTTAWVRQESERLAEEARNAFDFTERYWTTCSLQYQDAKCVDRDMFLEGDAVWIGKTIALSFPALFVRLKTGTIKMFWFEQMKHFESTAGPRLDFAFQTGTLSILANETTNQDVFGLLKRFCQRELKAKSFKMNHKTTFDKFRTYTSFNHIPLAVERALSLLSSATSSYVGIKRISVHDDEENSPAKKQRFVEHQASVEVEDVQVVVVPKTAPERDPLTQQPLLIENGKFPLLLECGHVYNYSTVYGRRRDGRWLLRECAVGACGARMAIERSSLREFRDFDSASAEARLKTPAADVIEIL